MAGNRGVGPSARLADHLALHLVITAFPAHTIDRVLLETDRVEKRQRLLSARTTVYCVLAMAVFPEASYHGVGERLFTWQAWVEGGQPPREYPTKSAFYKARARLGSQPLRSLFQQAAATIHGVAAGGVVYGQRNVVLIQRGELRLPDTRANRASFGTHTAPPATLRLQVLGLVSPPNGTLIGAELEARHPHQGPAIARLLRGLGPDMLCIAEVGSVDLAAWEQAGRGGAAILWSVSGTLPLAVREPLGDGTYLAELNVRDGSSAQTSTLEGGGLRVNELDRRLSGNAGGKGPTRLVTDLRDPAAAPAESLIQLHRECMDQPTFLARLGPSPGLTVPPLRSKGPEGIAQEAFAHLCVHHAITRALPVTVQKEPNSG